MVHKYGTSIHVGGSLEMYVLGIIYDFRGHVCSNLFSPWRRDLALLSLEIRTASQFETDAC